MIMILFSKCYNVMLIQLGLFLSKGFGNVQGVLDGKYDDLSEQSFYMVGGIEEVIAKAEKIAKESAS
jgi:hypothetical protein